MLPILEKQGFERLPDLSTWGWNRTSQGYSYTLGRLRDNKLQKFEIYTLYRYSYFYCRIEVFILEPMIDDLSELPSYDPFIFYPESNYPCVQKQFRLYKFKKFRSKEGLKKRSQKLSRRIEKNFSNIDKLYSNWSKSITPIVIDLEKKKKERKKMEADNG